MKFVRESLCCLSNAFCSLCNEWVSGTYRRVEEMQLMGCLTNCTFQEWEGEVAEIPKMLLF